MAFVSSNRLHIELQRRKGSFIGKIIAFFVERTTFFISTCLVGNTITLVVYGVYMAELIEPSLDQWFTNWGFSEKTVMVAVSLTQTIISTTVVLATGEFLPKSIAMVNPDKFMEMAAIPMRFIYAICFPIVWAVVTLSNVIIKAFKIPQSQQKHAFEITDLNNYLETMKLSEEKGKESELNAEILGNALEFKNAKVRDCMIPRKEIVACDIEEGVEGIRKQFIESGHSKLPIYRNNINNVLGYCHSLHLFRKPKEIEDIMTEIITVPESFQANELMIRFIREHKSMALVVDEFGGTSGLVTMEDLMEQIFGEIKDEHDDDDDSVKEIAKNTYLLSARNEIDYLNTKFGWNIPEGDYDTLGGYILSIKHNIPEVNEVIENNRFRFVIKTLDNARIDLIEMTILGDKDEK
ncbi:MAG: hemolysin family protein [Flammeovirgaceae bacterium]